LLAADAAEFYTSPKNASAVEFRDKIEEVVQAQAKRGNLVNRKDAWAYLRGGDLYETLQTRGAEAQAAKIKEAQAAAAAGPGANTPRFSKPIDQLNTDELGEALKDMRF
jgi:protein subunit release factor B